MNVALDIIEIAISDYAKKVSDAGDNLVTRAVALALLDLKREIQAARSRHGV